MRRFYSKNLYDFEPYSVVKVIKRSGNVTEKSKKPENQTVNDDSQNTNQMGIQMISRNLFKQIFKNKAIDNPDTGKIEKYSSIILKLTSFQHLQILDISTSSTDMESKIFEQTQYLKLILNYRS
jgi:hypothetical protein